ncbi:MAG TPA: RNA-binding cell elongation regulator Jag/EloR [Candidatus Limnocylindrales bacterium]|jgi:spoIIIJ-associated protein
MSAYREFTGKTVEEALRDAREAFGVGLDDLDFEILSSGSRGVLGMGAEPARVLAAPRSELGGAAPKREAAAAQPLPPPPPREERERGRFGDRDRGRDRGGYGDRSRGRFGDRERGRERPRPEGAEPVGDRPPAREDQDRGRGRDRGPRRDDRSRGAPSDLSASETAEVVAARGSLAAERADLEAAEASPEALTAGREILEELMRHLGFAVRVDVETGDTSRLNVVGEGSERDALGALIGRKGERLSALQHLVNLMLSKRMGGWTRVLVDVEDYRGRRERQLRELAARAAARVVETGKMLQLEAMPALERRWIHLALRENPDVATQSIGEEPNRRIVVLPRDG